MSSETENASHNNNGRADDSIDIAAMKAELEGFRKQKAQLLREVGISEAQDIIAMIKSMDEQLQALYTVIDAEGTIPVEPH